MSNPFDTAIDGLIDSMNQSGLTDAEIYAALTEVVTKVNAAAADLTAPITHNQRGAMFATFAEVFGSENKQARRIFTRLVLGKGPNEPVSWADPGHGTGTLTKREAFKVLDALVALRDALA